VDARLVFKSAAQPSKRSHFAAVGRHPQHYRLCRTSSITSLMENQGRTWEDVRSTSRPPFDRLGIPEAERKFLAHGSSVRNLRWLCTQPARGSGEAGRHLQGHGIADCGRNWFPRSGAISGNRHSSGADNKLAALKCAVWRWQFCSCKKWPVSRSRSRCRRTSVNAGECRPVRADADHRRRVAITCITSRTDL